jgi:cytochrome c551/c552
MERLNVLIALVSLGIGSTVLAVEPSADSMNQLATAKGCHLCHRAEPGTPDPKAMLPYAPSWKDIALRYKGQKGAEQQLTLTVLQGPGGPRRREPSLAREGEGCGDASQRARDRPEAGKAAGALDPLASPIEGPDCSGIDLSSPRRELSPRAQHATGDLGLVESSLAATSVGLRHSR